MEEVGIFARVDRNVADAFKAHVLKVHGKLHGAMSQELERAMKDHVRTHSSTHEHTTSKRVTDKKEEIKKQILKDHDLAISKQEVEHYIARVAGSDPRTVNKYFNLLQNNTFLEHDRFGIFKIVHD